MSNTVPPLRLLRYLFVLRVNSTLVRLPVFPALEFSRVLAEMLADRLPSQEAKAWRKVSARYGNESEQLSVISYQSSVIRSQKSEVKKTSGEVPDVGWPVNAVLHVYPGKQVYGQGELILWELKLLEESADHRLFLELFLPTLEAASVTTDPRWNQPSRLWGHFEIAAIHVALGRQWQPLVQAGRIDLAARPTPTQWATALALTTTQKLKILTWLTPFALGDYAPAKVVIRPKQRPRHTFAVPDLATILAATGQRVEALLPGWLASTRQWPAALEQTRAVPVFHSELRPVSHNMPGQGSGSQMFGELPTVALPYLTLGSLVHIGAYTHLGCGTFLLDR